jgi:replicative DNA helicase
MAKNKYKGKFKASVALDKKKSLSDIEKTRRKLQAIEGREIQSIRLSAKDMIDLNRAIQELEKNKALIEDTYKGTPSQKASTWSRK